MTRAIKTLVWFSTFVAQFIVAPVVLADGVVVDKVYHPYVDALEREIELRSIFQDAPEGLESTTQKHQLSLGTSIGDHLFGELYVVGEKTRGGNFSVDAFEAELKWQLTEQGEYAADWGLLFEYENETEDDIQEATVGILAEKEWGNWSGTGNLLLINEWGDDIDAEFESVLALQARYRYSQLLEPTIELYAGQDTLALGPVLQGNVVVGLRKSLHWEAGLLFGLDQDSPDQTVRLQIEYEF
ncbi:MAG: hypothetical protein V4628_18265 [Pseudomonadota bacterium]